VLVTCPSCGKRRSDRAPACPFCGQSPPKAFHAAPGSLGTLEAEVPRRDPKFHLSAGSAVARTFRLWGTNFFALFALGALVKSPAFAVRGLIAVLADPEIREGLSIVANLVTLIFSVILEGAVAYFVIGQIVGSRATIAVAVRTALACGGTMVGAAFLAGLAVLPGCACLVVPGLILATWLWVAVPVVVIESPGAAAALTRSRQLTSDNRWPVFACMAYLTIVRLAGFAVVVAAVRAAGGPGVFKAVTGSVVSSMHLTAGAEAIIELLTVPLATLGATGTAVVYHDLRSGKEGISDRELRVLFESSIR